MLNDELVKILNGKLLMPYFQPIVSLKDKKIIGYDVLIYGPADSPLHNHEALSNAAGRLHLLTKLESVSYSLILRRCAELKFSGKIFINANMASLAQLGFEAGVTGNLLAQYGVDPASLVIVLNGLYDTDGYKFMSEALRYYRGIGIDVAVEVNGGFGLELLADVQPDYLKLDKHFIQGLENDLAKQDVVRAIQDKVDGLNCNVVADGVGTEREFRAVSKLGIGFAQGHYFSYPTALPLDKVDPLLFVKDRPGSISPRYVSTKLAKDIAKFVPAIPSTNSIDGVFQLFQRNSGQNMLPLVDNGIPVGLVFRERFLLKLFSNRYGLELYGKKPISQFIDQQPLIIEHDVKIQDVSQQVTAITTDNPAFIITRSGNYLGVATILDLLEEITSQQIQYARYANPLTLLPGSVPVNDFINQLLLEGRPFGVGYFDLDHFKPFNDVYGYSAGDDVIKLVADILIRQVPSDKGMVGHIGGDDFIVVFVGNGWQQCCRAILDEFAVTVLTYYSEEDRKAGGIYSENRVGEHCFFPVISLSVGLVPADLVKCCRSHVEIADLATDAKKQAKKITGNSLFVNNRKPDKNCC